jgi:hypothetical protein
MKIEKGSSKYECRVYDKKIGEHSLEIEKNGTKLYIPLGNTTENTPIKVGTLRILTHARKPTPSKPWIESSSDGSVVIKSDAGTKITYKGETKNSGSTWTHDSYTEYSGTAYAYFPGTSDEYQSHNSVGLWIGMLGKPRNIGKDWHWDNYGIKNKSGVSVDWKVTGTTKAEYSYESQVNGDHDPTTKTSDWYFHTKSGTLSANSESGDIWEANGVHDSTAKLSMWASGKTFYQFSKTGWVSSVKVVVKSED